MGLSPDQQIERLRRAAWLAWVPKGLFALTLVLITLGLISRYEFFFVAGAFAGLGAIAAREAAPHWRNAITAIHNGRRSKGSVSIAITRDPTAFDHYVATVRNESQQAWQFEFTPNCWEPAEGDYKAEIYYVRSVEWPALLITQEGVLFPAFTPKKLTENT
ncbi:MAG: hypothetical protein WC474_04480 [Hydrogenophilaceae bacterium]